MNYKFLLAATFVSALSLSALGPQNLVAQTTTDFEVVADGRIQSSGALGESVILSDEDIDTHMSGPSNISHGIFEFDLAAVPSDATLLSAELLLRTATTTSNTGNTTAPVDFFAYTGDGIVDITDFGASATLLTTENFAVGIVPDTELSVSLLNLSQINSVLSDGNRDDFLTIRSEVENFVTLRVDSLESTDINAAPARLRLTYNTASVPEPTSAALLGLVSVAIAFRRTRSQLS